MLVPYSTQFTNYNRAYRWTGLQITNKIQRAVIQTIAYSAVFNYPLTAQEIKQYLISELEIGDSLNQLLNYLLKPNYLCFKLLKCFNKFAVTELILRSFEIFS